MSQQSHVSFAESDTLIPSQQSFQQYLEEEEKGEETAVTPHDPLDVLDTAIPTVLPLTEWIPEMETVIKFIRDHQHFNDIMSSPNVFDNEKDSADFLEEYFSYSDHDGNFWYDALMYMIEFIEDNTPSCSSQLKRCRNEYHYQTMNLVDDHFRGRRDILLYSSNSAKYAKLQNLSGRIGYLF
jgi:hypothetical protein